MIFCGEVVTVGLLERCLRTLGHVQFINLYSISETHDIACADLTEWYNNDQVIEPTNMHARTQHTHAHTHTHTHAYIYIYIYIYIYDFVYQKNAQSKKFCPVGQLLPGVSVVIMDNGLRSQPVGVPGEVTRFLSFYLFLEINFAN